MATLLNASLAVTVKLFVPPAVVRLGYPLTVKLLAPAAFTVMPLCVPVMDPVTVSVAVSDCVPAVFNVALKVPTPLVSVEFADKVAAPSLLVKWTVPA